MSSKKIKISIFSGMLVLVTVCAIVLAKWFYSHYISSVTPIASAGGAALELPVDINGVYFLQTDPLWGNDAIGGSGELLSSVGCTISAVAMAAGSLGYDINPGELNKKLIRKDGYTKRGWLIWSKVKEVTEGKISVRVPSGLSYIEMDQALLEGSIPIVKYYLPNGMPHWIAVVGKTGREYLIKDSLDSSKQIRVLSEITKKIVSVRYVATHQ
jgi:hypothetical protein